MEIVFLFSDIVEGPRFLTMNQQVEFEIGETYTGIQYAYNVRPQLTAPKKRSLFGLIKML